MSQNLVSAQLTAEDQTAVLAAIQTIRQKLPFLVDLTPAERQGLPKMGDKSRAFVSQTLEVATLNENHLPRSFNLAEFRKDAVLLNQLAPIAASLAQLNELVDDTITAVGSDAYVSALAAYQSLKLAGQGGGLDGQLDGLAARFAKKTKAAPKPV